MGITIGFSVLCQTLSLFVVAVLPIKVTMTSGESFECDYQSVTKTDLVVDTGATEKKIPFDELQSITRVEPSTGGGPAYRLSLIHI